MNFIVKAIRKALGIDSLVSQNAALQKELDRVNELRTIRVAQETTVTEEPTVTKLNKLSWADLTRFHSDVVEQWTEEIQASIISLGYKAIPEVLNDYRTEMIQHYAMLQKISLGSYAPELDNMDSYTREQLIKMVQDLNQLSFEKRMTDQGKAEVTKKQIDMLAKWGVKAENMPKNRFEASRMIEEILTKNGVDTSKPYSTTPSDAQMKRFGTLCTLTGRASKDFDVSSRKAVSGAIAEMQQYIDEHPELLPAASQKQKDLVKTLMKTLKKRMTAKKQAEIDAMNTNQISKLIGELQTEVNTLHPELSDGQLSYLITLLGYLRLPYNVEELKVLTKAQATAKIEQLRKQYLYLLTRKTNPSVTKEQIADMSTDLVKQMIDAIRGENATRDYTVDSMTKDSVE